MVEEFYFPVGTSRKLKNFFVPERIGVAWIVVRVIPWFEIAVAVSCRFVNPHFTVLVSVHIDNVATFSVSHSAHDVMVVFWENGQKNTRQQIFLVDE